MALATLNLDFYNEIDASRGIGLQADEKSREAMVAILRITLREVVGDNTPLMRKENSMAHHAQDSMALTTSKDHVTGHTRTALTANAMSVDMDDMISEVTYGISRRVDISWLRLCRG
ncbi:hypothetical protein Tco_0261800 [Tanacetum coccineum]